MFKLSDAPSAFASMLHDGVVAVPARLAELGDPFRLQIFDAERTVAVGPRFDGNQMQNFAQPARDAGSGCTIQYAREKRRHEL